MNFEIAFVSVRSAGQKYLLKIMHIGAASIHKNQTANPPKTAPKLFSTTANNYHHPN